MINKTQSLYEQLEERISRTPAGTKVPSVRQLMQDYGVSQVTVVTALKRLNKNGFIQARVGDGTYSTGQSKQGQREASLTIGVATHDFPGSFQSEVIRAISNCAGAQGHKTITHHFDWDSFDPFPTSAWHVDAVVFLSCQPTLKAETLMRLGRMRVPVVILDRSSRELEFDTVSLDNQTGGALAARHLIDLGHKRLAVLTAQPKNANCDDRIDGFLRQARFSGIEEVTVLDCQAPPGAQSIELAHERIQSELANGLNFTGLFCVTDYNALGALSALHENGRTVPGQVSVIGFDNLPESRFFTPALTTISQNLPEWGERVMEAIQTRIARPGPGPLQRFQVSPVLLERKSTARPGR